ncbi:MAG TPA: sulfatase-like hydrolase/transferase [Ramlibacter sp.]|nr:sulfatase-like hydrolase/transferase [Ramlibacter sp.]
MSTPATVRRRRPSRGAVAAAAVLLGLAAWFAGPQAAELMRTPLGLGLGLGVAGYLLRRNPWDAAVLGLPLLAGDSVEIWLGSLLVAVATAATFAATRRPRFAAYTGVALLGLLVVAIRLKERFAGAMLTWHDLKFFFLQFADNVGVMASQPTLLAYAAATLVVLGGLGWFCWRLDRAALAPATGAGQAAAALLAAALAVWSGTLLRAEVTALGRQDAWILGSLGDFGRPLSAFLATAGRVPSWAPPPADTTAFGARVQRRLASAPAAARAADIVLFLQESQFNPASIDGCPESLCRLDFFEPSARTQAQGPLQVHIFGGGTWLTEFAVASGVPHLAFGPAGDFAPFTVAPSVRRSFARSLRAAGYRTVALYPVRGGMMNARLAYASYGFDRFLDSDDLGLSGSYATTDEDMHAAARRVLAEERRHGAPVFLMVVTIFNHGEHGARMDRVPPGLVASAATSFPEGKLATNVADYAWRTREFARAFEATRAAVVDGGPPAVLAWFGDHQPAFGNALALRDRIRAIATPSGTVPARMQTWYQVHGNTAFLPREAALRPLDVVFLPGLLAQAAGARWDEWLAANVLAREECAGLLQGCAWAGSAEAYLTYLQKDLGAFAGP